VWRAAEQAAAADEAGANNEASPLIWSLCRREYARLWTAEGGKMMEALLGGPKWILAVALSAAQGLGAEQSKPIVHKSKVWDVRAVAAVIVRHGAIGKPAAPPESQMIEIEITSEYIGPEAEVPPPSVAVVGASGAEYKPLRGYTAVNAEAMGVMVEHLGWLMSSSDKTPKSKRLRPGTSLTGVIHYVAVPQREAVASLKLQFADVEPFLLKAK
jgi:hypothetical protein